MTPDAMRIPYEACPLCGARELALRAEADCTGHPLYRAPLPPRMRWMACRACDHCFTDGYWSAAAESILFSAVNEAQQVGYDYERQRGVAARMIEKVLPWRAAGRWLDVGFGNAALPLTAAEFGYEPVGIDLRAGNVAALATTGIEAHCCGIEALEGSGRFDVISMNDVLEHMAFPPRALAAAARLLAPGGVLFVSMPNRDSPLWALLDRAQLNPYWAELEHLHNFGRRRLYRLLEDHGFRPVRYAVSERYRAGMEVVAARA